jgi:protocatechuate 3,4-dioxygenase beta subunit
VAGPFYPVARPLEQDSDLTRVAGHRNRARGQIIQLVGRVFSQHGEPVAGARVELWQANNLGRYNHSADSNPAPPDPDFQGYAVQLTDREGRFRFTTIKPGPYPDEGGSIRAPHIHFVVSGHIDRRITQLFFAGEPLNFQDPIFRQVSRNRERLIAALLPAPPGEDPATRLVRWDVVLPHG